MTHHPRVQILVTRALLLAASLAIALTGAGCQMPSFESMNLGDTSAQYSGGTAGANSEAVFEPVESRMVAALYGRENLPESSRLDGRMNIDNPQPRLATADWPQYPAPDAANVRYIYLPVSTSTSSQLIPVYQRKRQYNCRPSYYYR
ncbi:MAG: hypothetical protein QM783_02680 [Phycisphaerales bacterium]